MDAENFDLLARMCGLQAARRGIVSALLGGVLGTVLSDHADTAALRGRRQQVTAEKRKRRKKKKKKNTNPNPPTPRDEAPPCTTTSCPLPPGCSQSALDSCSSALFDDIAVAAQECEAACQDSSSQACQTCVDPIATSYVPGVIDCVESSCGVLSPRQGARRDARSHDVTAEAWWIRTCDKPCCYVAQGACEQDVLEVFVPCLAGAIAASATGAGVPALVGCTAWVAYGLAKCRAREGCASGYSCTEDNACCATGSCGSGCCPPGSTCTTGTYHDVPRSACCAPNPLELGPCDGVCCGTPASVSMCCPGKSNPCTAIAVGCG